MAGLSLVAAVKSTILLLTVAGGIGMYLLARELMGCESGLLSAGLFLLAPYRFTDIFMRNAFSEFTALMVAPFVFHAVLTGLNGRGSRPWKILYLAAAGAAMMLSHVLSLVMYVPLFLLFFAVETWRGKSMKAAPTVIAGSALGALLASFYLTPLLFEREYVQNWRLTVGKFEVLKNFTPPGDLLSFGGWLSLTPAAPVFAALACAAVIWGWRVWEPRARRHLPWMLGVSALLFFLMIPESAFAWRSLPFLRIFQFPWRLMSPLTLLLSLAAGSIVCLAGAQGGRRMAVMVALPAVAAATLLYQFRPAQWEFVQIPEEKLSPGAIRRNCLPADVMGEYTTIWTPIGGESFSPPRLWEFANASVSVQAIVERPGLADAVTETSVSRPGRLNISYFPGWRLTADGAEIPSRMDERGTIEFTVPSGRHELRAEFGNTPARRIGNLLSLLGLGTAALLMFFALRRRSRRSLG